MSNEQKLKEIQPNYKYTVEYQPEKENENYPTDSKGRVYYPYLPSDDLIEAVNLAIALERPLLLEGEPGCGKTRLASAVVYEFTKKNQEYLKKIKDQNSENQNSENQNQENQNQKNQNQKNQHSTLLWWSYYIWNIKSTTRARDGLYRYDAVARLRDAQLMGTNPQQLQEYIGEDETKKLKERLKNKEKYIEFGPFGKALQNQSYRSILLIDEIDKADSDFANDLLLELEELRFEITETGQNITTANKPIIFITSNREKPLPEPFLRRCLYFYVEFPQAEKLKEIIELRFGEQSENKEKLVDKAIKSFYDIHNKLKDYPGIRPPGTSEFMDFLTAILNLKEDDINTALNDLDKYFCDKLYLKGTLLKTKEAQNIYPKVMENYDENLT
ncbi:ATPase AAA [Dulcicalothrix desertica PCC 7102]|uniref:ATPase AAA n=1 Tax=Dulcicalothrix desertica PCC 7102 TaxID=232991 RepID=A0A3S1CNK3_9CYAN|nr:ATPase AAA [Dulcicalothrix desertica PCC 7102]TWH50414.1 MoxR-like ATPase [Dulcicalothrix desertica PCC 7102]